MGQRAERHVIDTGTGDFGEVGEGDATARFKVRATRPIGGVPVGAAEIETLMRETAAAIA